MRTLLDTNVISESQKARPDAAVERFLSSLHDEDTYLSVITIGELVYGISRLPRGARRERFSAWLDGIERQFASRILDIDVATSRTWGELAAQLHARGDNIEQNDGFIAATALRHGLRLATRNVSDFAGTSVLLINPWEL